MPAERLYYDDAYLRSFTARVTARIAWDGQPAVALDRSAFYPEGGGQPADHGVLNGVAVVDVQARDSEVWHVLERSAGADGVQPGVSVVGEIDWARRFDHMQQHLGQHLLTAAFIATCGASTTSFHLGAETATIDLDIPALNALQVEAAEACANQVIWESRAVTARFVASEELATLPLRKAPTVDGPVRVVSVPNFDYSPCGGTHPQSTGGVGIVAVRGWWRHKRGVRVEFVCGGRASRDFRRVNAIATRAAAALSVGQDELEDALARLRTTNDANRKELASLRTQVLDGVAQRLLDQSTRHRSLRVVCHMLATEQKEQLRDLAQRIAAHPGGVALLGVATDRASLVVACAEGLAVDARTVLAAGLPLVQGRGGGSPTLAQGGGPELAGLSTALDAMLAVVVQD